MLYNERLNEDELDIMKEISNICSGHAADALSGMLGRQVRIEIPTMQVVDYKDAMAQIGDEEKIVGAVLLQLRGEFEGILLFMYDLEFANIVIEPLLHETAADLQEMSEDHYSVMSEVGNIIAGAYISGLSKMLGMRIDMSVPTSCVNMLGAIVAVPMAAYGFEANQLIYAKTEFIAEGIKYPNWLMMIPSVKSMENVLVKMGDTVR